MSPRLLLSALVALAVAAATALPAAPARAAAPPSIHGFVADATTGAALKDVCVTLGPPIVCFTHTDATGFYLIDLEALAVPPGSTWDLYFLKSPAYQQAYSEKFVVDGPVTFNQVLMPTGMRQLCPVAQTAAPTQTVYLPNVTKTLGGATGWQTPFIVQNTGSTAATLEITFQRFLNGACAVRRTVAGLAPGTSFADVPDNDMDIPGDTQFAVVVKTFGSTAVSVVNEQAGTGERSEAMAYVGASQGATSVFLPNITRRFFGYDTPFIIQNLGLADATVNAHFVTFDGSAPELNVSRTIPVGASKFVDPNFETGLIDGKQYAVTVSSDRPVSVVVNTQNDAATVGHPVAYSTNGIATGATVVYGPYAARNAAGIGRVSTIVVQNLGTVAITPSLQFDTLGGGAPAQVMNAPTPVKPGHAWAFDPRFAVGTTTPCHTVDFTCLADGEYSFIARSNEPGANIAVAVNVISDATAMGYTALATVTPRVYLPNITRRLGGPTGWTTPILLQAIGGTTGATVKWFRFSDGQLVMAQSVTSQPGLGLRIDPRDVPGLSDDTQYSVIIDGTGGSIAAIVTELASGGDNAMIYEGFAVPAPATR